jgi:hypothetical protein
MVLALTIVYLLFVFNTVPSYAAYNIARDYSGSTFFSEWDFYGNYGWQFIVMTFHAEDRFTKVLR